MKMQVSDLVVQTLEKAGADLCYGIIGDSSNVVGYSISKTNIRWVHVRHEEAGAFAAGSGALYSNRLKLCCGTCGPGSLHFINGLYEAHRNHAPVVMIATQLQRNELGTQFPQEVDFTKLYEGCSYYCQTITTSDMAQYVAVQAAQIALSERGVTVIILPEDVANMEVDLGLPWSVNIANPVIIPSDDELKKIAAFINQGKKIAIYGGSGCQGATEIIKAFSEKIKAPVAHATRAKDFIEPIGENNMGAIGWLGTDAGTNPIQQCDTLLMLGADYAWASETFPKEATLIQLDINPRRLGRRHPITLGAIAQIKPTLERLINMVEEKTDTQFLDGAKVEKAKIMAQLQEEAIKKQDGTIRPQYLTKIVNDLADDDAVIVCDSGSALVWLQRFIKSNGKRRTFYSLLHGTIGNGFSEAMGVKLASPKTQVIALCGDGGFSVLMGDLLTLVQEKVDIKIIIYNNATLGFVEMEQELCNIPNVYTHLQNPNFGKLAEVVGLWGKKIDTYDEVLPAVKELLASEGAGILDVITNKWEFGLSEAQEAQVKARALAKKGGN